MIELRTGISRVMEWSDVGVGSESEREEEMLWSCLQYCTGNDDCLLYEQQQIDILQLEPFSGVFPVSVVIAVQQLL